MPDSTPRIRTWTVRSRIVTLLTGLALVSVFVSGTVAYLVERSRVLEQIDRNLETALDSGSATVANADEPWSSVEEALGAVVQRISPDDNTGTLGIVGGRPYWEPFVAPDVQLDQLPGFVDRVVAETTDHETVVGTYVHEGETVRYLAAPVTIGHVDVSKPPTAVFVVGYDVQGELAEINDAARVFVFTALLASLATFLIGLWVSGRLLQPVRRMREVAERSSAANASERIPVGDGRDDVSQLALTVNRMLDRLGGALDSQRELLRDVGHELKTPITIVRGHLELVDPNDPQDVAATRELALDELDRMALLVDDLRAAARLRDPGAFAIRPTDVAALTQQIALKARAIQGAEIDETVPSVPVLASLDPDRITQGMLQFVANAARHGRGPITVGSRTHGRDLELYVRDRGPGVPDELKTVIFERFHRGEASGRGDGGSGLGLSIVQLIAETHRGRAWVGDAWYNVPGRDVPARGAEFVITLPGAVVPVSEPSGSQPGMARVAPPPPPNTHEESAWHRS